MDSQETLDFGAGPKGEVRRPGRRVGPYELLRELGHGGMGVVYLAARADQQYEKQVALKVIKGGLDSGEVAKSFRRERQILAALEHPNIARFLDGGTTEDGLPYLVMEYIEGRRLDEYCQEHELGTRERLQLFRAVCSATAYAHRNLIVHRDIKPGNILVTAEGVPKLLDFGLAKIVAPSLAETATSTGLALTPAYASPEQARGEPVTTSSDVYSLGVVLYELLTGQLPYRLRTQQPLDVLRAVCEEEPDKPSAALLRTVVSAPTEVVAGTAVARGPSAVELERLRRRLRGDLDTIVLAALAKEPHRRYASVDAFSDDLGRYLEGLPIAARKPTFGYRAGKFLRRNWAAVAAASVALLLVVGFSVNAMVQSARVRRERDKAERVATFLVDLFKVSDPNEARGNAVTAREILEAGAQKIRGDLQDEPEVRATLMDTLGRVHMRLGLYARAEELLREALAVRRERLGRHPDLALTLHNLANVMYYRGDYEAAERLGREALTLRRELLGDEHPDVARSSNNLAIVLRERGDLEGAEELMRATLRLRRKLLGNQHPDVGSALQNLAILLTDKADYAGAAALFREALDLARREHGNESPDVASRLHNLAVVVQRQGDLAGAEPLYREGLELRRKLLGPDHPELADSLLSLAGLLAERGDPAAGEAAVREALAIAERALGREHIVVATAQVALADVLHQAGRTAEAEAAARSALAMYERLFPNGHPDMAEPLSVLGLLLTEQGRATEGEPLLRRSLELRRKALPAGHPSIAAAQSALGACLAARGQLDEAERLLRESEKTFMARGLTGTRAASETRARLARLPRGG